MTVNVEETTLEKLARCCEVMQLESKMLQAEARRWRTHDGSQLDALAESMIVSAWRLESTARWLKATDVSMPSTSTPSNVEETGKGRHEPDAAEERRDLVASWDRLSAKCEAATGEGLGKVVQCDTCGRLRTYPDDIDHHSPSGINQCKGGCPKESPPPEPARTEEKYHLHQWTIPCDAIGAHCECGAAYLSNVDELTGRMIEERDDALDRVRELEAENARLAAEGLRNYEWNSKLVASQYELGRNLATARERVAELETILEEERAANVRTVNMVNEVCNELEKDLATERAEHEKTKAEYKEYRDERTHKHRAQVERIDNADARIADLERQLAEKENGRKAAYRHAEKAEQELVSANEMLDCSQREVTKLSNEATSLAQRLYEANAAREHVAGQVDKLSQEAMELHTELTQERERRERAEAELLEWKIKCSQRAVERDDLKRQLTEVRERREFLEKQVHDITFGDDASRFDSMVDEVNWWKERAELAEECRKNARDNSVDSHNEFAQAHNRVIELEEELRATVKMYKEKVEEVWGLMKTIKDLEDENQLLRNVGKRKE